MSTPLAALDSVYELDRTQPHLHKTHHPVEQEADNSDRQNAQQNVGIDQAVVFLPEEAADSGRAREHLAGDDDEPRNTQTQAISREHVRQCRRQQHLGERLEPSTDGEPWQRCGIPAESCEHPAIVFSTVGHIEQRAIVNSAAGSDF